MNKRKRPIPKGWGIVNVMGNSQLPCGAVACLTLSSDVTTRHRL